MIYSHMCVCLQDVYTHGTCIYCTASHTGDAIRIPYPRRLAVVVVVAAVVAVIAAVDHDGDDNGDDDGDEDGLCVHAGDMVFEAYRWRKARCATLSFI